MAAEQFGDFVKACARSPAPRVALRRGHGGREYGTTLEDLDRYFLAFAVAARARRGAR